MTLGFMHDVDAPKAGKCRAGAWLAALLLVAGLPTIAAAQDMSFDLQEAETGDQGGDAAPADKDKGKKPEAAPAAGGEGAEAGAEGGGEASGEASGGTGDVLAELT